MKKELIGLVLCASILFCACGANETEYFDDVDEDIEISESDTESMADEVVDDYEFDEEQEIFEMPFEEALGDFDNTKDAYTAFIKYMIDNSVEPDGLGNFFESYPDTIARNMFAVFDIDGDGDEELIIDWTNPDAMAGYTSFVLRYDLDTKEWVDELEGGGALTVFDNGVIFVGAAHNQGYGELWPYTILKYNSSNDMFEYYGSVDSEDKELVIDSMGDDSYYHYEYDPTGCGTVYMFDAKELGYEWGYYSKEQFEELQNTLVGNASIIEIDFKYINKENLEKLL